MGPRSKCVNVTMIGNCLFAMLQQDVEEYFVAGVGFRLPAPILSGLWGQAQSERSGLSPSTSAARPGSLVTTLKLRLKIIGRTPRTSPSDRSRSSQVRSRSSGSASRTS